MRYKLIIFDLDGTILDTLEDLHGSINHALSLSSFPHRSLEEVRSFVGNGIRKLVERSVPDSSSDDQLEQVYRDFISHYRLHCADHTRPYEGILEVICDIRQKGCQTAVVSNKADTEAKKLCQDYFPGLFDFVLGQRKEIPPKPDPAPINLVLNKLGISKEKALYIGDSEVDIATAVNTGIDAFYVDWGFRTASQLKAQGAEIILSSPREIIERL
ncbi:MAG: HAD-IA family hydrolase [Lachnospiraceae bacterium]|nr:HAD-IA family hydrolase [Lachnospiraceae bacterium]